MSKAGKDYSFEFEYGIGETPAEILKNVANVLNLLHCSLAGGGEVLEHPEPRHAFCELLRASEMSIRGAAGAVDASKK